MPRRGPRPIAGQMGHGTRETFLPALREYANVSNSLRPLASPGPDPYMRAAQAPRGCAKQPVRPSRADHSHFAQQRGYAMRTFDLAPLYRSTVCFDRLFSMLDGFESAPGYPPYNIERTGENTYRISVAVAGFGENELSIEAKENTLTIKGDKQSKDERTRGKGVYQ